MGYSLLSEARTVLEAREAELTAKQAEVELARSLVESLKTLPEGERVVLDGFYTERIDKLSTNSAKTAKGTDKVPCRLCGIELANRKPTLHYKSNHADVAPEDIPDRP